METSPRPNSPPPPHPGTPLSRRPGYVVALLTLTSFLVEMGLTLNEVPSVSVVTALICSRYYNYEVPAEQLTEQECTQNTQVVEEVNRFLMINTIISSILTLLVALAFAAAADVYGRKRIFSFCILGMLLSNALSVLFARLVPSVSVESIWWANVAVLLGGGFRVAEALVFTMITDVADERWRTTWFQIAICGILLAEILGSLLSGFLLGESLWLPMYLGLVFLAAGQTLAFFIPETLHMRHLEQHRQHSPLATPPTSLSTHIRSIWHSIKTAIPSLPHSGILPLLPAASLVIPLGTTAMFTMIQALPTRYATTFAQSSQYEALRGGTNLAVLLIILPLLSYHLRHHPILRRDALLNLGSSLFLVAGMLVIAAAPNLAAALVGLVLFSLGAGVPALVRSIIAQVVDRAHWGALFGVLAVLEQLGGLVFSLVMAALLQRGLAEGGGGGSLGYPFWFAFAVLVIVCACSWFARPRAPAGMMGEEDAVELTRARGPGGGVERGADGVDSAASRE